MSRVPNRRIPSSQNLFSSGSSHPKFRSGYNHFSDLFSEFTKHISPAFNHERPERSVQMRLYTMQKGQHLLIFIMFFSLFFIALLMGMAGPKIITEHNERASSSSIPQDNNNLPSGPFFLLTPKLSSYRKQLWISAEIMTQVKYEDSFSKRTWIAISIDGVLDPSKTRTQIGGKTHNRTRTIRCNKEKCEPFIIVHLGVLKYPCYIIHAEFSEDLKTIDKHYKINDIVFNFMTYNPQFIRMEIWFRCFFVVVTVIISVSVLYSLKRFALLDWSIEQKWIVLLLPLLVGFNNPLFSLTIMSDSILPRIIDVSCQATFLFSLLIFWLCVFHGLRQTERGFYRFYLPKFILVWALWMSGVTMAVLEEINELQDPTFSYELNVAHYKNFQLFFIGTLAVYIVYLLYLMLRAFGELRSMNFLDARLKFHAGSMALVLILTLSILSSRYGAGVLEDNFIARLYTSYESGGQFLAFYTVLNTYIYVLAYVYTPTSSQSSESLHVMRDNPAFSMINESDDEEMEAMLIPKDSKYGSPQHTPLGRLSIHGDDSD